MATIIRLPSLTSFLSLLLLASLVHAIRIPNTNTNTANHDTHTEKNIARRSVTLDLQRNPHYAPNGPAAYARALKKWGADVPQELTNSLAAMRGDVGGEGEVRAETIRDDREYLSRVGFGTPLQWLNVDLDTGSSDVWVYSSETRKWVAGDRPVWKIEESSTAEKVENATWMISYGDGSSAWGNIYRDTLSIASITLPNATLESAISASTSLTSDPDIDGLFGLAYGLPSQTTPQQPSVLSALLPHLSLPLFTADLHHHASSGAYTFGRVDPSRYKRDTAIWYTPLVDNATFWEFPYRGVHVGGQDKWYLHDNFSAIADTGTTLMLLSRAQVRLYYSAVPGARQNWTVGGVWTYPCLLLSESSESASASSSPENGDGDGDGAAGKKGGGDGMLLPDFEVGFRNGFVATVPGRFMNYTVMPDDASMCMGGLQEWGYDDWGIFGDIFLKAVYAVFDVGGGRVGFAEKELGED